ncbi:hypothetical protein RINTU1_13510 [Candidatus Regiella insecticola]|uniref:Uncharacterized protein n=1 Tax=Candidatus Regiella insecticola TaxID=138073 RepID=A0A6L2ZP35_9ENTR|nr:hypothetical protein RINTU1_13510 [Candidatus Regiella insecticola]
MSILCFLPPYFESIYILLALLLTQRAIVNTIRLTNNLCPGNCDKIASGNIPEKIANAALVNDKTIAMPLLELCSKGSV